MKRRVLAGILSVSLCMGLLAVPVSAEEITPDLVAESSMEEVSEEILEQNISDNFIDEDKPDSISEELPEEIEEPSDEEIETSEESDEEENQQEFLVEEGAVTEEELLAEVSEDESTQAAVITAQPEDCRVEKAGDTATFTVTAEHAAAYQWYYSKDQGSSWYKSSTEGSDTNTLSVVVTNSNVDNVYRCKVTGENGKTVISESAGMIKSCGENLIYRFEETEEGTTLVISGNGPMNNYTYDDEKWLGNNSFKKVVIEDGVTSIGDYAFYDCSSLTSVVIPDSVTSIGNYAFASCSSLTSVVIPDSVTYIGSRAFASCSSLTSVVIPDSVTHIGDGAFASCSSLTSVVIPDSVTHIGDGAFAYCSSLTSVVIPGSVTSIGYYAFYDCSSLTSVVIPDSVTSIGYRAFRGCSSLTSVVIPDSVTFIGSSAFAYCSSLTSIVIPDSVTYIGSRAFASCSSLTSVVIPDSVTSIGYEAFEYCSSLTSVVIPDSVTSIGSWAFYGCNKLTIYGEKNSYAQTYAKSYNIPFKVINAEITKQPKYQTFHELGETVNFSVAANNAASYQWYYSKDGDNWFKCTTEGSATNTLSITVTSSNATRLYRCKVTGDNGKSVTSEAAGLIGFIKQPADVNAAYRDQVTFSGTAVHATGYQWYYSKDGSSWFKSTATGNDTDSITLKVTSTNAGHQYRCVITGINGKKVTSDSAEINIYPGAVIVKQPSYQPATGLGENVIFKVSAKRAASYQWYYSSNGGTSWNRCTTEGSNINALSVTVTSTTVKRLYRCKVTGKDGKTVTTEQAGIIAILSNPKDVTGSRGDVITFTVQASNAESYQWYFSKDGSSWYKSTATGNTSDTLSLKLSRSNASNMYRCVVTGPDGKKLKSNIAKIELKN